MRIKPGYFVFLVVIMVAFLAGEGAAVFANDNQPLVGALLLLAATVALGLQFQVNRWWDRRLKVVEDKLSPAEETCVFELHVHRGDVLNAQGVPMEDVKALAVQARTKRPDVNLAQLAAMVRQVSEDLEREHHQRVSGAN